MAKRVTNQQLSHKIENLSDIEAAQVLEYIDSIESKRKPSISTINPIEDDLIDYLASASDNLCARQVIEWEKVRRRSDIQAELNRHSLAAANK